MAAALCLAATGCGSSGGGSGAGGGRGTTVGGGGPATVRLHPPIAASSKIRLSSPAFSNGGTIPARYTCAGTDVSPPLQWSGMPAATKELALVMIDLDAPNGSFTHWLAAGIPPTDRGLPAHLGRVGAVPGRNDLGKLYYGGPCPPPGRPHRYVIELLALRAPSGLTPGFRVDALKRLRPLAAGVLWGTFGRR